MVKNRHIPEIALNKESGEPLHLQLKQQISDDIFKRRPSPGSPFISERQLAELLELNRVTVHRAYDQLMTEGVLRQLPEQRTVYIAENAFSKVKPAFPAIGIILPRPFSQFVGTIDQTPLKYISGLLDRTAELGYAPMLLLPPPPESSDAETREWLENVMKRLTAVIHLGHRGSMTDRPLEIILHENFLPQIFVSGFSDNPGIGTVSCDIESGIAALAEYLKEKGHHKLGVVGDVFTPPPFFRYTYSMRTDRGVRALRKAGMEIREEWIHRIPNETTRKLLESAPGRNPDHFSWLRTKDDYMIQSLDRMFEECGSDLPSVFWCSNDFTAIRLCNYLQDKGFRVPYDFSVVGCDDNAEAERADIPLTTLRIPMYQIGRQAIDLALDHFFKGVSDENRCRTIPATLMIRQSVEANHKSQDFLRTMADKHFLNNSNKG